MFYEGGGDQEAVVQHYACLYPIKGDIASYSVVLVHPRVLTHVAGFMYDQTQIERFLLHESRPRSADIPTGAAM